VHLAKSPGAFAISPGDQGGTLVAGITNDGSIAVGDMDLWRFVASKSNIVVLRCEELSGGSSFNPRMRLFGITGNPLATNVNSTIATITNSISTNGTYTLLVDGGNLGNAGTYRLTIGGITNELRLSVTNPLGGSFTLGAQKGAANSQFILYSTTNLSDPLGLWVPILTNQFDSFGTYLQTNLFDAILQKQFFLMQQK
jgi:hypothetical protein